MTIKKSLVSFIKPSFYITAQACSMKINKDLILIFRTLVERNGTNNNQNLITLLNDV